MGDLSDKEHAFHQLLQLPAVLRSRLFALIQRKRDSLDGNTNAQHEHGDEDAEICVTLSHSTRRVAVRIRDVLCLASRIIVAFAKPPNALHGCVCKAIGGFFKVQVFWAEIEQPVLCKRVLALQKSKVPYSPESNDVWPTSSLDDEKRNEWPE